MISGKELLAKALAYRQAGREVIPDHPQFKYPKDIKGWEKKDFTEDELKKWIIIRGYSIGIRNTEALDFDNHGNPSAKDMFDEWCNMVHRLCPGLVDRLVIETTQSGGYHVGYKCSVIEGNQDLAQRPATPDELMRKPEEREKTLIETRGQGGQVMVAPSPGYELIQGDWLTLPEITPEEREILFSCARSFHKIPENERKSPDNGTDERPGDRYNSECASEALELLEGKGWEVVGRRGDDSFTLRRPGKEDRGVSATWGFVGSNKLYVFSSNASPFKMRSTYTPFAIYTELQHNGDFKQAAKELAHRFGMNGTSPKLEQDTPNDPQAIDEEPPPPMFKRLSFSELVTRPDKEWLIDDLLGRGDYGMIFGDSGTGKTFAAINLVFCGVTGLKLANRFSIPRPLSIAYAAGEGVSGLPQRFKATREHFKDTQAIEKNLHIFLNIPQLFDEKAPDSIYTFIGDWIDSGLGQLDLLILDTLHAAAFGADENHAKDAGLILKALKAARDTLGCAVLLVHHANKQGTYRGSTALHGAMDVMLQTKKLDSVYTLECFKMKDAECFNRLFFRLQSDHTHNSAYAEWMDETTVKLNEDEKPTKRDKVKVAILDLLTEEPGLLQSDIVSRVKCSRNTTLEALKELEALGKVETQPNGTRNGKSYQLILSG